MHPINKGFKTPYYRRPMARLSNMNGPMARYSDYLEDENVGRIAAANKQASLNLRGDIERLRCVLELAALRTSTGTLVENLRKNEEALRQLLIAGEDLQAEIDACLQK